MNSVADLLVSASNRWPNEPALKDISNDYSWNEVKTESNNLASEIECKIIENLGSEPFAVAIWLNHSVNQAIAIFATSISGSIFTVINSSATLAQVRHQLQDSNSRILISDSKRIKELSKFEDLNNIQTININFKANKNLSPIQIKEPKQRISTDVAAFMYTSGSTGKPKGVIVPHSTFIDGAKIVGGYLELNSSDKIISVLPLNFDYGLNQLFSAAYYGCQVIFHEYFLPIDFIDKINDLGITGFAVVPTMWGGILEAIKLLPEKKIFENLRYITTAGGPHSIDLLERIHSSFNNTRIFVMYGLTESFRSAYLPPEELLNRVNSIGKAVPGVELLVLDENLEPCPPGVVGELYHRGLFVNYGYLNNPELTNRKYIKYPGSLSGAWETKMVKSGDFVKLDNEGFIYYVGRMDEQLKVSGFRISPNEIEEFFYTQSYIKLCAAIQRNLSDKNVLVLYLESTKHLTEIELLQLQQKSKSFLPFYAVPSEIIQVELIPKTSTGKIDYSTLRELDHNK